MTDRPTGAWTRVDAEDVAARHSILPTFGAIAPSNHLSSGDVSDCSAGGTHETVESVA